MSATTSSSPQAGGGIWNALGKKGGGANNSNTNKKNTNNNTSNFGGTSANDPNVMNLTSIKAAGIRGSGNGPAVQRIVVIGHCMSGKRSFIDRLRKASEPPLQESKHFHGKFGAQRAAKAANAAEEMKRSEMGATGPAPKTISATIRGCGLQYTSLAYHHNAIELDPIVQQIATLANDDTRTRKIITAIGDVGGSPLNANANKGGYGAGGAASGGGAAVVTTSANSYQVASACNCSVEVIGVDVVESLDAAIPTFESLQYTAVIIVIDAMDIANSNSLVSFWTNAVNARVRTLTYLQQNGKATNPAGGGVMMQSTTNTLPNASAAVPNNKQQGVSKSLKGPYAGIDLTSVDVRVLLDKRGDELSVAKSILKDADIKARVVEQGKVHGAYVGNANSGEVAPPIPESLRMLLPSMIVLSKVDLLEEACKATSTAGNNSTNKAGTSMALSGSAANNNSSMNTGGDASAYGGFPIAIQHARWLALQRGAAFTAVNNKDFSSGTSNFYQSLWTYIAYGLLPGQFETVEYLKQQIAALNTRDGLMTAEEQEEESRREIEALDAKRKRKQQQQQQRKEAGGNEEDVVNEEMNENGENADLDDTHNDDVDGNNTSTSNTKNSNTNNDDQEDRDFRRRIMLETLTSAVLLDAAVREIISFAPSQQVFVPRGLDEALLIEKQTTSSAFVQVRFSTLATTNGCDTHKATGKSSLAEPLADAVGSSGNAASPITESAAEVTRRMFDNFALSMQQELSSSAAAAQRASTAATGAGSPSGALGGDFSGGGGASTAINSTTAAGAVNATSRPVDTGASMAASRAPVQSSPQDDDEAMIWDE